jgi:hypothetical protein
MNVFIMSDLMPTAQTLEMIWSVVETFLPEAVLNQDDDKFLKQVIQNIKSQIWLSDREEAQLKTYILGNLDLIRSHFEEHLIP